MNAAEFLRLPLDSASSPQAAVELVREFRSKAASLRQPLREISLWGCGYLGRWVARTAQRAGIRVARVFDSNAKNWGRDFEGTAISEPSAQAAGAFLTVYNCPSALKAIKANYGCELRSFYELFLALPELFLPYCCLTLDATESEFDYVPHLYERMGDAASKKELLRQVLTRNFVSVLAEQPDVFPHDDEYFVPAYAPLGPREIFLDCGAFDGDTVFRFARKAAAAKVRDAAAIAVEADPANFIALVQKTRDARIPVRALNCAVTDRPGIARFDFQSDQGSHRARTGEGLVVAATIDDIAEHADITFVKMDIEGGEESALRGASRTIAKGRCKFAISAYHKSTDLRELTGFFDERFALHLAAHAERPWDSCLYLSFDGVRDG